MYTKVTWIGVLFTLLISSCVPAATPTVTAEPAKTSTSTPAPATGKWLVETEAAASGDSPTVTLSLLAEEPVEAWRDTVTPQLILRCKKRKLELSVNAGTQFEAEAGTDQFTVRVRLDNAPAKALQLKHSKTGDVVFFDEPRLFYYDLLKHDTLLFGFTPFSAPAVDTTFDLHGLGVAAKPLDEACP